MKPIARSLLWLVMLCASAAAFGASADEPLLVRGMLAAGAHELALAQIESAQPADRSAPQWPEWEALLCEVLSLLGRDAAVLERARALPIAGGAPVLNACWVAAARAALRGNDPEGARNYAARLLWGTGASTSQVQAARLSVIESYLAERRAEDAYGSMLRFQHDYRPLERDISERFAEGLLDIGHDAEALNWVPKAQTGSAARLRLQLRSGMLPPDVVIAQAREVLATRADPAYWRTIYDAAVRTRNASLQLEALERLLQSADPNDEVGQARAAQRLWDAYIATAAEIGNREQLLMGDDGAWADYASRRLAGDALLSRAFFAYLAQRAQTPEIRRAAQLQLAYSLYTAGLDATALRAMQRIGFAIEALDEQTRYLLGTIASRHNDAALATKLWNGLPTPPSVDPIEWQLTLARTALQAGDAAGSAETMRRLLAGRTTVSIKLGQRVLEIAQEMLDLRTVGAAQIVYELLVPLSTAAHAREALFGLGRASELGGKPVPAAAYYLRSALLVQAAAPDSLAFQARLLAALNLLRAGLRNDARAQFEWLLGNAKDPALIEAAKRGLSRL